MAPNRNEVTHLINALETLDVSTLVEAKYLPLTHSTEEFKHVQQQQQQQQEEEEECIINNNANASYWEWEAEEPVEELSEKEKLIQQILKEEEIRQSLSVTRIEENLVEESKNVEMEEVVVAEDVANDDYWSMPAPENDQQEQTITAQHLADASHPKNSYWNWPRVENKNQAMIDSILRDEAARQLLSMAHTEQTLSKQQPVSERSQPNEAHDSYWAWDSQCVASHVGDPSHPRNDYWEWNTAQDEKEVHNEWMQQIIEQENIRQMLAVEHVEEQLARRNVAASAPTMVTAGGDNSAYWGW